VKILVKIAILICFVRNNVELNIKWNMTENSAMVITLCNTYSGPLLIYTPKCFQTIDALNVILGLQNKVAFIYRIPHTIIPDHAHIRKSWEDTLLSRITYDHHLWAHIFSSNVSQLWRIIFLVYLFFTFFYNCRSDNVDGNNR
jgi:hypothetical protein